MKKDIGFFFYEMRFVSELEKIFKINGCSLRWNLMSYQCSFGKFHLPSQSQGENQALRDVSWQSPYMQTQQIMKCS